MALYLSTESIMQALKYLNKDEMANASIFFTVLVMKRLGVSATKYMPQDVLDDGRNFVFNLGSMYAAYEQASDKHNFIYPFAGQFLKKSPGESLEKWATGRLRNNVLGGATTWRGVVEENTEMKEIKFSFDYVSKLTKLCIKEKKVNILALAIWSARFNEFDEAMHEDKLIRSFKDLYKINDDEYNSLFFVDKEDLLLEFSEELPDYGAIRKYVDHDSTMGDEWSTVDNIEEGNQVMESEVVGMNIVQTNTQNLNEDEIYDLFELGHQMILSGPPGTSKSFVAKKVGEKFHKVYDYQFHPKTSYNEFIGGYKVNGSEVAYEKGVLLKIIDEIIAEDLPEKKYLLIIDEINRTNLSQVFGEVIQCLDRNYTVSLTIENNRSIDFSLPKNLLIIGTQNSSDRTLGNMDFALKRRFLKVDMYADPDVILSTCSNENNMNSVIANLLHKINTKLFSVTKNIDFQIGHAVFLDTVNIDLDGSGRPIWTYSSLEKIFNYKVLPIVIDFCYSDYSLVIDVLGELSQRLHGQDFENCLNEYIK